MLTKDCIPCLSLLAVLVIRELEDDDDGFTNLGGRMPTAEDVDVVDMLLLLERNKMRREGKADSDKEGRGKGETLFNHCCCFVGEGDCGREEEERKVGIWISKTEAYL